MHVGDLKAHWEGVYASKDESEVSWYEATPQLSLELIAATGAVPDSAIIDVGGGASRLADALLDRGHADVTVLDLAEAALARSRARLGRRAADVRWIAADATAWTPQRQYDVWHDRAVFHFLTTEGDQNAYLSSLRRALRVGGHAIIATFGPGGPDRCSGLPVQRYDAESLSARLGAGFTRLRALERRHATPLGATQEFTYGLFRRAE